MTKNIMSSLSIYSASTRLSDLSNHILTNYGFTIGVIIESSKIVANMPSLIVELHDNKFDCVYQKTFEASDLLDKPDTYPLDKVISFCMGYNPCKIEGLPRSMWVWNRIDKQDLQKRVVFYQKGCLVNAGVLAWKDAIEVEEAEYCYETAFFQFYSEEKPYIEYN